MASGLDVSKMNAKKTVLFMRKYQEVSGEVLKKIHLSNRRLLNQVTSSTNLEKQILINKIYDQHVHGPKSTIRDLKISERVSPDTLEVPGSKKSEAIKTNNLKAHKPVSIKIHPGNFSGIDLSGTWNETGPGTSLRAKHQKSNLLRDPESTSGLSPESPVSLGVRGGKKLTGRSPMTIAEEDYASHGSPENEKTLLGKSQISDFPASNPKQPPGLGLGLGNYFTNRNLI